MTQKILMTWEQAIETKCEKSLNEENHHYFERQNVIVVDLECPPVQQALGQVWRCLQCDKVFVETVETITNEAEK